MTDLINHPPHYTSLTGGVECIQITEHMGFNLGNALKYIWRADEKGAALDDLRKAAWYIQREINRRSTVQAQDVVATVFGPDPRGEVRNTHSGTPVCNKIGCGHARSWHNTIDLHCTQCTCDGYSSLTAVQR